MAPQSVLKRQGLRLMVWGKHRKCGMMRQEALKGLQLNIWGKHHDAAAHMSGVVPQWPLQELQKKTFAEMGFHRPFWGKCQWNGYDQVMPQDRLKQLLLKARVETGLQGSGSTPR